MRGPAGGCAGACVPRLQLANDPFVIRLRALEDLHARSAGFEEIGDRGELRVGRLCLALRGARRVFRHGALGDRLFESVADRCELLTEARRRAHVSYEARSRPSRGRALPRRARRSATRASHRACRARCALASARRSSRRRAGWSGAARSGARPPAPARPSAAGSARPCLASAPPAARTGRPAPAGRRPTRAWPPARRQPWPRRSSGPRAQQRRGRPSTRGSTPSRALASSLRAPRADPRVAAGRPRPKRQKES